MSSSEISTEDQPDLKDVKTQVPTTDAVALSTLGISYSIKGKKLLNNMTIHCKPGELFAIIGPSGGGKTSLLNILCQRANIGKIEGKVLFNGQEVSRETVKKVTNYVMAHDRLYAYLTVEETMHSYARLKLGHLTYEGRKPIVDKVLEDVQLTECRNTYVGGEWKKGISTGELKRLCIGLELIDDPQVILLDEPTSGLDSVHAMEVIMLLKEVAKRGRTVICTIHQPRSQVFAAFDKFLLLSGGKVVYQGPANAARDHFASLGYNCPPEFNPADFFLELVSERTEAQWNRLEQFDAKSSKEEESYSEFSSSKEREKPQTMAFNLTNDQRQAAVEAYMDSDLHKEVENQVQEIMEEKPFIENNYEEKCSNTQKYCTPKGWGQWVGQFAALWLRATRNSLRNPIVCLLLILVEALQGFILGGVFYKNGYEGRILEPINGGILDEFWQSPWGLFLQKGVDLEGNRPILDIIEHGVDGYGSKPLTEELDPEIFTFLHDVLDCTYEAYNVNSTKVYPDRIFPIPPEHKDFEGLHPNVLVGDVVTTLQLLDWVVYTAVDNISQEAKDCFEWTGDKENSFRFYFCLMSEWKEYLDPVLGCAGLPPLPWIPNLEDIPNVLDLISSRTLQQAASVSLMESKERSLLSLSGGVSGGLIGGLDILSDDAREFFDATLGILERLTECNADFCKTLNNLLTNAGDILNDYKDTIFASVNVAGCLFFAIANLGFTSYDVLLTFPQERAVYNREIANGLYRTSAFYIAKQIADMPFQLLPALTMSTIFYFLVGLGGTAKQFFLYFLICGATSSAAYAFGYFISAASPRMEVAVLLCPLILVIFLLLSGFFLRDSDIPTWIGWLRYFSFYRWGFFALVLNEYSGDYWGALPTSVHLEVAGITQDSIVFNSLMLVVLSVFYRLLGYFCLKYTNLRVGLES